MPAGPSVLRFSRGLPPTKQYGERLRLLVRQGQDAGTCYSLLGDLLFVGREGCQIVLNDTNISRKHAEISWAGDHYVVRDLGSANGIVFNGNKTSEAKLQPGDIMLMGLTVLEVYPSGQTRKTDRPLLSAPVKGSDLVLLEAPAAGAAAAPVDPVKKAVEKKRTMLFAGLGLIAFLLYMSDPQESMRDHTKIEQSEDVETPTDKEGKPIASSHTKIVATTKAIQDAKLKLVQLQAQRAALEEKEKTAKSLGSDALGAESASSADKQQRKDAEIFFRSGVRELQNRNYRRAFTAFDTALTVDPNHDLAKIYLKSAKMELLTELWGTEVAGLRAKASLRYREARMHFENIVHYLENENADNSSLESEGNKELSELLQETKKELEDLDKLENRSK